MIDPMAYDWFTSSAEARQALYSVAKRAVASRFLGDWNAFLRAALNDQGNVGSGYIDNFRAGRISRVRAGAIARWLEEHEPALALQLAQILDGHGRSEANGWTRLTETRAVSGGLSILKLEGLRIVSFARNDPSRIVTLRRGETFCLRLKSGLVGYTLGLQRAGALWFPLPLTDDGFSTISDGSAALLPRTSSGEVIPLSEEEDTGPIDFVVVISPALWLPDFASSLSAAEPIDVDALSTQVEADLTAELQRASAVII